VSSRARGRLLLVVALALSSALVTASIAPGGLDRGRTHFANPSR
jgi:hypothetical protein